MATMPVQKPGRSKQDYSTPDEFMVAMKRRLGISEFQIDLAASFENSKSGPHFYSKEDDSLTLKWEHHAGAGWCWLNPPYDNITPWAKKLSELNWQTGFTQVAFLVPASVGSNWFRDYVDGKAKVLLLNGRLSFDGVAPYPKDCILCLYGPRIIPGYEVWDWRKQNA